MEYFSQAEIQVCWWFIDLFYVYTYNFVSLFLCWFLSWFAADPFLTPTRTGKKTFIVKEEITFYFKHHDDRNNPAKGVEACLHKGCRYDADQIKLIIQSCLNNSETTVQRVWITEKQDNNTLVRTSDIANLSGDQLQRELSNNITLLWYHQNASPASSPSKLKLWM